MRSQYQSLRQQCCNPTVSVVSGGQITAASFGSYTLYLQARNRAGYNLFTNAIPFTLDTANQRVSVIFPADARRDGEDLHQLVVSLVKGAGTAADAKVVAAAPMLQSDQVTPVALPMTFYLSRDAHFALGASVANRAALPGASDRLAGMRRQLTDEGLIVEWDIYTSTWTAPYPNSFSTYVSSTTGPGGCDRDVRALEEIREVIRPIYPVNGSLGTPVRFLLVNTGSSPVAQGTRIGLSVAIGQEDMSELFSQVGGLKLTFLGYVELETGELDTLDLSVGLPVSYENRRTNLVLQKPLPPGWGFLLQVAPQFDAYQLQGQVPQGVNLLAALYPYLSIGAYTDMGTVTGDLIAAQADLRRLVPLRGLSARALAGSGIIHSYSIPVVGETEVVGFLPNTDNQIAGITGNGAVLAFAADSLPEFAAIRAIMGTVNGLGRASNYHNTTVTLNNATQLRLEVTFPTSVRGDYPDVIAGSDRGEFNATALRVFVRNTANNQIVYYDIPVSPGASTQTLILGAISGTAVNSLPAAPASDFGLFAIGTSNFAPSTQAGSAVWASGTYSIAIAPFYSNTITRISHDPINDCIPELTTTIAQALASMGYWSLPVASTDALRAISAAERFNYQVRVVALDLATSYVFDPRSQVEDDDDEAIKPDDIATNSLGRWVKLSGGGSGGGGLITLTENLTLYVDTASGSDNNDGSGGSPFLTPQKAIDVATGYIIPFGKRITIDVTGNVTQNAILKSFLGGGEIEIQGNLVDPLAQTWSVASGYCLRGYYHEGKYRVRGFNFNSGNDTLMRIVYGELTVSKINFGNNGYAAIEVRSDARFVIDGTDGGATVSGANTYFLDSRDSFVDIQQLTFANPVTYNTLISQEGGSVEIGTITNGNNVSGKKFSISKDATLYANGNSLASLPGTTAGTISKGSKYVYADGTVVTNGFDVNGSKITGLATPTAGTDAANKAYADTKEPALGSPPADNQILNFKQNGAKEWVPLPSSTPGNSTPGTDGLNADMTRTSTTSNTVGAGSKTFGFSASSNIGWVVGSRLRAVDSTNTANWIEGQVTALSSTSVTINSVDFHGSGTATSWNIAIAGERGAPGADGTNSTGGGGTGGGNIPIYVRHEIGGEVIYGLMVNDNGEIVFEG